jgi:hypothetical protein
MQYHNALNLWDSVVSGVVVTTVSFVDMVTDRLSQISKVYESSLSSQADNVDDMTGTLSMPKAQFEFVEKMRKSNPKKLSGLLDACDAVTAMITDEEKETYIKKLVSVLLEEDSAVQKPKRRPAAAA